MKEKEIKLKDGERTRCEIWTRVMGYYRPVSEFNRGKKSEFEERKSFREPQGDDYGREGSYQ